MNKEFEKYLNSISGGYEKGKIPIMVKSRQVGKSYHSQMLYELMFKEEEMRRKKVELRNSKIDELLR